MPSETYEDTRDSDMLKRGSMYLSSKDVWRMREVREGRIKQESACGDDAFISFEIANSLPQFCSKEVVLSSQHRYSLAASLNGESKLLTTDTRHSITIRSIDFLDLSLHGLTDKHSSENISCSDLVSLERSVDDLLGICLHTDGMESHTKAAPVLFEAGYLEEQVSECNSHPSSFPPKSMAKAGKSKAPFQSQYSYCNGSPKTKFNALKRLFDPVMKSKSLHNSWSVESENTSCTDMDPAKIRNNGVLDKSIANDYSKVMREVESDAELRGEKVLTSFSLPSHLHGILKLETNSGNPSFEFHVKDPEVVLSAMAWRTDNMFNWVYTIHSSKKRNYNTWSRKIDKHGQSPPIVGQMQVSCCLCSEMRENGPAANSSVTEFILYDIVQAKRSFSVEESSECSLDATCPLQRNVMDKLVTEETFMPNNVMKCQHPIRYTLSRYESDDSTPNPWLPADLRPELEIAAIVIQTPFTKKECSEEMKEVGPEGICNGLNSAIVNVITPSGRHGLPNVDAGCPSTLLDRWRFGGGCDCGGWDMGCPLEVFHNTYADDWVYNSSMDTQKSIFLFGQGSKEKAPALSITADGRQYLVDFHAKFSSLQAFSICIAILHSSEASAAVSQENRQTLQSNSLKILFEEEVRHLIGGITVEEKRKVKNGVEQVPPSFFVGSSFSPVTKYLHQSLPELTFWNLLEDQECYYLQ
ncbi:unnamed protein product [Musa banksii]